MPRKINVVESELYQTLTTEQAKHWREVIKDNVLVAVEIETEFEDEEAVFSPNPCDVCDHPCDNNCPETTGGYVWDNLSGILDGIRTNDGNNYIYEVKEDGSLCSGLEVTIYGQHLNSENTYKVVKKATDAILDNGVVS